MKPRPEAREIEIIVAKKLSAVEPGDTVLRWLGGCSSPMPLSVKSVTANRIVCAGGWEFDRATGAEIDETLGWGPGGMTGSYIEPQDEVEVERVSTNRGAKRIA
jgi:hypothetical protein